MSQVRITDGKGKRLQVVKGIEVLSSGGVPPQWAALTEFLPPEGKILDYGSWQGVAALWLKASRDARVDFAHYSSALLARAGENASASQLTLEPEPMFPLQGRWDTVVMAAPAQSEALVMLAGQAASCLNPGGQLLLVAASPRAEGLRTLFSDINPVAVGKGWAILRCTKPRGEAAALPWRKFPVALRGFQLELKSLPGIFSPGGLDSGTELMLQEAEIPQGGRVLDLGCGYGVVGIVASKLGAGEVVYLDEDLVALTACRENIAAHGLEGEVIHSHLPWAAQGKFDCILVNPPYHTDYGVPRAFLEFAARRLNPRGWVYVVVKKPLWYRNKLRSLFGGFRSIERNGYHLLSSQYQPLGTVLSG